MVTETDLFATKWKHDGLSVFDRIDASGDCWEWTGTISSSGYGSVRCCGKTWSVHRLVWEALVGPIPNGLEIDHLCLNKRCSNPDHLEPVTHTENFRRSKIAASVTSKNLLKGAHAMAGRQRAKTHCPNGHPYSGKNLYVDPSGSRKCRQCHNRRSRERYHKLEGIVQEGYAYSMSAQDELESANSWLTDADSVIEEIREEREQ